MGAAGNETGNFPVCDAKPRRFIGETTFDHPWQVVSNGSNTRREERDDREDRTAWTGPGSVIPLRCSMSTRRLHERMNTRKRLGLRAWIRSVLSSLAAKCDIGTIVIKNIGGLRPRDGHEQPLAEGHDWGFEGQYDGLRGWMEGRFPCVWGSSRQLPFVSARIFAQLPASSPPEAAG